jgi:hypothetical protein
MIAGLAMSQAAVAKDTAWAAAKTPASPAVLTRSLENVSLHYHAVPNDSDSLKLTVTGCGDEPWSEKDDLDPDGIEDVRTALDDALASARNDCTLSKGLEERFMAGFDAAYAKFEKLKK